jgi:hypothetical protein
MTTKTDELSTALATIATPNVVPFGKYRGQPVEVLRQDQNYLDWLAGQEGIRRQYPWIFAVTAAPADTPEHNHYQALFLDREFAEDVYRACRGHAWGDGYEDGEERPPMPVSFEQGMEVPSGYGSRRIGPADVQLGYCNYNPVRIEIKPAVGDDYPSVLRQMLLNLCGVLYLVNYTGTGVTIEQMKEIFARSGVRVLLHSDFWEV